MARRAAIVVLRWFASCTFAQVSAACAQRRWCSYSSASWTRARTSDGFCSSACEQRLGRLVGRDPTPPVRSTAAAIHRRTTAARRGCGAGAAPRRRSDPGQIQARQRQIERQIAAWRSPRAISSAEIARDLICASRLRRRAASLLRQRGQNGAENAIRLAVPRIDLEGIFSRGNGLVRRDPAARTARRAQRAARRSWARAGWPA